MLVACCMLPAGCVVVGLACLQQVAKARIDSPSHYTQSVAICALEIDSAIERMMAAPRVPFVIAALAGASHLDCHDTKSGSRWHWLRLTAVLQLRLAIWQMAQQLRQFGNNRRRRTRRAGWTALLAAAATATAAAAAAATATATATDTADATETGSLRDCCVVGRWRCSSPPTVPQQLQTAAASLNRMLAHPWAPAESTLGNPAQDPCALPGDLHRRTREAFVVQPMQHGQVHKARLREARRRPHKGLGRAQLGWGYPDESWRNSLVALSRACPFNLNILNL